MMKPLRALLAIGLAYAVGACTQGADNRPVPRRVAYPRIELADTLMQAVAGLPLCLEANAASDVSVESKADGQYWVSIAYPACQASIYVTLTPVTPSTAMSVVDNRIERLRLDMAGAYPVVEEWEGRDGFRITMATAKSALSTPIEFIAARPSWVVSGTVFFQHAENVDSVAPVIKAMGADVRRMLNSLSAQPCQQ